MPSTADGPADGSCMTRAVPDEGQLAPLARELLAALPRPAFVALHGDLGAGKTTLVKALAAAAGIDPAEVVSPTFGLIHEHPGPSGTLLHADLYRLRGDDLREVGWHDAVARADWAFVEWPEHAGDALPADRLDLWILIDSPTARTLQLSARGPRHAAAVDRLRGNRSRGGEQ